MTITNATFVIERLVNASPARVFAAYASVEAKSAWFKTPTECQTLNRDFDFVSAAESASTPCGPAA